MALYREAKRDSRNNPTDLNDYLDELIKDPILDQAVTSPVNDALSEWRTLSSKNMQVEDTRLKLKTVISAACIKARMKGGVLVMPVLVTDTPNLSGVQKKKVIPFSTALDTITEKYTVARVIFTDSFESSDDTITDPLSDQFGLPTHYQITDDKNKIHPSRAFVINANQAGISFIEAIEPYYTDFCIRREELTEAVRENNFLLLGTDMELLHEIATDQINARGGAGDIGLEASEILTNRLRELRTNANSTNAYGIDKESESVSLLLRTNINQLISSVDNASELLAAASDIPSSRFLGKSVSSGLGVPRDDKIYMQSLTGLRSFLVGGLMEFLDRIIAVSIGDTDTSYKWNKFIMDETPDETTSDEPKESE